MFVCLHVWNLYKFTFLNRSEPNFAHVSALAWKRPRVCMYPKFLISSTFWGIFFFGGHCRIMGASVFRDNLISAIPAGVCVTSATFSGSLISVILAGVPLTSRKLRLVDPRVIRHRVGSLIKAGVRVTSRILRSTGRGGPCATAFYPSFQVQFL